VNPGLRTELERLREGAPVLPEDLRRVGRAALRDVPLEALLGELARRGGWADHPSGELRAVLMTEAGFMAWSGNGLVEDLTPPHSWRLLNLGVR
jgi:hypothetical protein